MTAAVDLLRQASFLRSAHKLRDLPADEGREVAFAGRSNAGKSSALNTLTGQTRLAHVSKTPGRTQLINHFHVAEGRYLVDLPGYGYAKVPETVRRHWQQVMPAYLGSRESLVGLVVVMDCRHPFTDLDVQMLHWFAPRGRPVLVLLTKADKLSRGAAAGVLASARSRLAGQTGATALLFSSLRRQGVAECADVLADWLELATDPG